MKKTNPLKRQTMNKARLMKGTAFQLVAANYRGADMFLRTIGLKRDSFLGTPYRMTSLKG